MIVSLQIHESLLGDLMIKLLEIFSKFGTLVAMLFYEV